MTLNVTALTDKLVSYATAAGLFESVNGHEPKSAPVNGLSVAVWAQRIVPLPGVSGLASTTALVEFNLRIYQSMLSEPQDAIDPAVLGAVDTLCTAFSGDFDLGGNVRNVDLLGAYSAGLGAQAGYINIDKTIYRTMTLTVPLVVNDLWTQVA